jgi:asparagine synthase (glutamine-hydrolysing)
MCGICGIVDYSRPIADERIVRAMTHTLAHRGPDDCGVQIDGPAGLGHTRLSILDLTTAGHQPMRTADGRVTLVYNGEVYNFPQLRRRLEGEGVAFRSRSDTEVVLQAYVRWGVDCFALLNGMFALALWDGPSQTLHLARDRFGIKPLYYRVSRSGVVFGSEIKAILASGSVRRDINWHALHEFFYYGNALGTHTMFEGIVKLLPGHHLTLSRNGVTTSAYWTIDQVQPVTDRPDEAAAAVRQRLTDAVGAHLVSDVPVGVFLSGGVDSSAIAALASTQYRGRLQTFSVGFDFDPGANELPKAKSVAERLDTEHHELYVVGAHVPGIIERLVECHDEPFADAANIPLYLLCEQLRGSIKVVLQGDGGDEMFGGYRRYSVMSHEPLWRWISRAGLGLSTLAPDSPTRQRAARLFQAMASPDPAMRFALLLTSETIETPPTRVLSSDVRRLVEQFDPFTRYHEVTSRMAHLDALQRLLYTDACVLLPDTYLEKVDKATMAHGIEVRVPFLDAELSGYAMGLPSNMKVRRGQKKWILRRALRGIVPDTILDGRKVGFSVPVDYWMRGPMADYLRSVLSDRSTMESGLFDQRAVEHAIRDHGAGRKDDGNLLYRLLNLALWYGCYFGNAP